MFFTFWDWISKFTKQPIRHSVGQFEKKRLLGCECRQPHVSSLEFIYFLLFALDCMKIRITFKFRISFWCLTCCLPAKASQCVPPQHTSVSMTEDVIASMEALFSYDKHLLEENEDQLFKLEDFMVKRSRVRYQLTTLLKSARTITDKIQQVVGKNGL